MTQSVQVCAEKEKKWQLDFRFTNAVLPIYVNDTSTEARYGWCMEDIFVQKHWSRPRFFFFLRGNSSCLATFLQPAPTPPGEADILVQNWNKLMQTCVAGIFIWADARHVVRYLKTTFRAVIIVSVLANIRTIFVINKMFVYFHVPSAHGMFNMSKT